MCYSAQIESDYRKYLRLFGATMSLKEFVDLFWRRQTDASVKIPKGLEDAFTEPQNDDERRIKELIDAYRAEQATKFEQDLFAQVTRLAEAERKLVVKPTKAASESKRIATARIEQIKGRLADLKRIEHLERDNRIFPGTYAPVMIMEGGQRVIKPMRYQCRPAGKPANYDMRFPGTYNARRDSLTGFWGDMFGVSHGLLLVKTFFENVKRHRMEGRELRDGEREENVILEFNPPAGHYMLVACLWSHWTGKGEPDLLSFAAITDEPPSEVVAAGHDRCIVPIKPENIDEWLNATTTGRQGADAVLEDRDRPFYDHRLAA